MQGEKSDSEKRLSVLQQLFFERPFSTTFSGCDVFLRTFFWSTWMHYETCWSPKLWILKRISFSGIDERQWSAPDGFSFTNTILLSLNYWINAIKTFVIHLSWIYGQQRHSRTPSSHWNPSTQHVSVQFLYSSKFSSLNDSHAINSNRIKYTSARLQLSFAATNRFSNIEANNVFRSKWGWYPEFFNAQMSGGLESGKTTHFWCGKSREYSFIWVTIHKRYNKRTLLQIQSISSLEGSTRRHAACACRNAFLRKKFWGLKFCLSSRI